ncbi:helix-turn-helix domain-containing protein [Natrinema salsiterrestre]|uniref:Helix-turn-helix domain-containing protein n=1 Tax=Natrinema salsiterrestre TaxID=2950540 RepID=A0A9Q4Q2M4_9EURY|nr:helix-turn-helix domain-containing protein [Natrinema salsiterrestre]MDF9748484.1 helix-turn-helix domain-containing protein [Natrinema salsiterrestre]
MRFVQKWDMSYIAEFHIVAPLVQKEFKAVPEMVYRNEELHLTQDGEGIRVLWASGDDFEAFESALEANATIKEYTCLTEIDGRRLYRITHHEKSVAELLYSQATEADIVFLDITTTREGSYFRVRAPTVEALQDFREICQEHEIPFDLQRLYREDRSSSDDPTRPFELTPAQHEVLIRAHERGYFHQPRNITLEELAEEFEVSSSALGRRMRRALDALIDQALRSGPEGVDK